MTRLVVLAGDPAPDRDGTISDFARAPILSSSGNNVAWESFLADTSGGRSNDSGVYRKSGNQPLVQIAREGQSAPDGNGRFSNFSNLAVNAAGQVAFRGSLTATTSASTDNEGIYRGDGSSEVVRIARLGQVSPDGNGRFAVFATMVAINDSNQVAFRSRLSDTNGDANGNTDGRYGLFRGEDAMSLVQVARTGQIAPDGNGSLFSFFTNRINASGQIAFVGSLSGTSGGFSDNHGVFRGDGVAPLVQLAREGQASPDGNGSFSGFSDNVAFNDLGHVAFRGGLTNTAAGSDDDRGIFRAGGDSPLVQITRRGETAPDGNGVLFDFNSPAMDARGRVVVEGLLTDTAGGTSDDRGVFRSDGASSLEQIIRKGQAAPDGNGYFRTFGDIAVNGHGQIALLSGITETPDGLNDSALGLVLFDDSLGLIQVASTGDPLLGSTIDNLAIDFYREGSGLGEAGQVAYFFSLADGRRGFAVATVVPEPVSFSLLTIAAVGSTLYRRSFVSR